MPLPGFLFLITVSTAADKYREAINLYRTGHMSITEIARRCGVARAGLAAYIQRNHRDLMMHRNGLTGDPSAKMRDTRGQRPETALKYREAIEAADSIRYLDLNISQIARLFHLGGTALANQLRAHYPEVIPRREALRRTLGIADNTHRGMRPDSSRAYAYAVQMLRDTDLTVREVADRCGVSFSGLRQHLLYYHRDLVASREQRRREAMSQPVIGRMSGNGQRLLMDLRVASKYAPAVALYRNTALSVPEIARRTGVNVNSLRHHLRTWYRQLMLERRRLNSLPSKDLQIPGQTTNFAPGFPTKTNPYI